MNNAQRFSGGRRWSALMAEAGVNPVVSGALSFTSVGGWLLLLAGVILIGIGVFDNAALVTGIEITGGAVVLMTAAYWLRRRLVAPVRWRTGTMTIRSVEADGVGEDGQRVVCRVTVRPPIDVTRVVTHVGAVDAPHVVAGAVLRCRIDRTGGRKALQAYPYAKPGVELPSGRALTFTRF